MGIIFSYCIHITDIFFYTYICTYYKCLTGTGITNTLVENLQIAFSNCTKIEKRLFTSGGLEFHNNNEASNICVTDCKSRPMSFYD